MSRSATFQREPIVAQPLAAGADLQLDVQIRILVAQGLDPVDYEPRLIGGFVRLVNRRNFSTTLQKRR